ncbi:MAG: hypothetical protein RLN81_15565 [Balneolaceae bacterium]
MRYLTLLLFFSILGLNKANAQEADKVSAFVSISADVVQSIELITVNSMTFGNTQPGQREIYVNPINDVNAGYMIAVGTPGAEFRLDYFEQRVLTQTNGDGTLTFTYEISANDVEDQASSELLDYENRNIIFNAEGRFYIWVGGRVNLENAKPGNYEGDFTIEIDYI